MLRLPLPQVELEKVKLTKRGDELFVNIGNFKREMLLPSVLAQRDASRVTFVGGVLKIRFPTFYRGSSRRSISQFIKDSSVAAIFDALANMAPRCGWDGAGFQIALRVQQNLQPHPLPRQFAPLLEHPLRLEYLDPPQMLDAFGVGVSMIVLDLGCGTGLFTRTAVYMVGVDGRIHAVDLQAAMLAETRQRVEFEAVLEPCQPPSYRRLRAALAGRWD